MSAVDSLHNLVYVKCSHQYIFQIYPQRVPQAGDTHPHTIRFCRLVLPVLLLAGNCLPSPS